MAEINLGALLARAMEGERAAQRPAILPEAAVMRLREAAERYADMYNRGCRFKVGDLVTPTTGRNIRDEGRPHLVVFVAPEGSHHFEGGNGGTHIEGRWLDMRLLAIADDHLVAFWVESATFETWTPHDPA